MAAKAQEGRVYPVAMDFVLWKLRTIDSSNLNVSLKSENNDPNGSIWFRIHHGMSMTSYGEKITVTVTPQQGGTGIHILSECGMPTQIIDYGKNKKNVAAIFRYLEDGMNAAPPAQYAPQPVEQPVQPPVPQPIAQPAPPQTSQGAVKYCPNCGAPNHPQSNFCIQCGTRLN